MIKQTFSRLLGLLFMIMVFLACEKPDDENPVTNIPIIVAKAELILQNPLPLVQNEEVKIYVIENAYRDNHKVNPIKYSWSVLDPRGKELEFSFNNQSERISWLTKETGRHIVKLNLEYDSINSKEISREFTIETDPRLTYTGEYFFVRNYYTWDDTHGIRNYPTTYYDGSVMPDYSNKKNIRVKCGDGDLGSWSDYFSMRILDKDNNFIPIYSFPTTHGSFICKFIGTDSLSITYNGGGLGGGFGHLISGKKVQ